MVFFYVFDLFFSVSNYSFQDLISFPLYFHEYLSLKYDVTGTDKTYEENADYIKYVLFDSPWDKCFMCFSFLNFLEISYFLSNPQGYFNSHFYVNHKDGIQRTCLTLQDHTGINSCSRFSPYLDTVTNGQGQTYWI